MVTWRGCWFDTQHNAKSTVHIMITVRMTPCVMGICTVCLNLADPSKVILAERLVWCSCFDCHEQQPVGCLQLAGLTAHPVLCRHAQVK